MQDIERARRRIKLRDLHVLLVIGRRGGMAAAAAELAMPQPAVSRAVSDMERALGVRLFGRGRGGVEPTLYGRALLRRGATIFDELTQGLQELDFLADPAVGELRIGSSESIAAGLLPAVIDRFTQRHPGVRINVVQTVLDNMRYRELRERSIDLLLGWTPTPFDEEDLLVEPLLNDPRVVVAGKQSEWARASTLKLADLAGERWVLRRPTRSGVCGRGPVSRRRARLPACADHVPLSLHLCCRLAATGRFGYAAAEHGVRFGSRDLALQALAVRLPRTSAISAAIVTLKGRR